MISILLKAHDIVHQDILSPHIKLLAQVNALSATSLIRQSPRLNRL